MFEHNGIIYYSENELKKKIENINKEKNKRLKTYATIRIWLLIILIVSLAGNLHFYLLYTKSNELLYLSNLENILLNLEAQIDSNENITEDKIFLKNEIKKEREAIFKRIDKIFYDEIINEIINDVSKNADKIRDSDTTDNQIEKSDYG